MKKVSTRCARSPTSLVSDTESKVPANQGLPILDEEDTAPQKKARKTVNLSAGALHQRESLLIPQVQEGVAEQDGQGSPLENPAGCDVTN